MKKVISCKLLGCIQLILLFLWVNAPALCLEYFSCTLQSRVTVTVKIYKIYSAQK